MLTKDPKERINLVDAQSHVWLSMTQKQLNQSIRTKYETYLIKKKIEHDIKEEHKHALLLMRLKISENRYDFN